MYIFYCCFICKKITNYIYSFKKIDFLKIKIDFCIRFLIILIKKTFLFYKLVSFIKKNFSILNKILLKDDKK